MAYQPHRILLIVEDDKSLREVLKDRFVREGFDILEAKNGEEGLGIALEQKPDMILLDIVMPVMDGITMLRSLRNENEWGKKVPVVILTNLSSANDGRNKEITELQPAHFLIKVDWTIDDVVLKVKEMLRK